MTPLTIPLRLVNEANAHDHWRCRQERAKQQKLATRVVLQARGGRKPRLPVVVTLTRIGRRRMDSDGAIISCKHVRDSIASWLGVDDGDPRIEWRYNQELAASYAVKIEIEAA